VAEPGLPVASATRPNPPIAAARSTLGEGRTRITKPTSATTHATAAVRGPARANRAMPRTKASTMATFEPVTVD
jgi:hypothetical protein